MIDVSKYLAYIVSRKSNQDECHGVGVIVGNKLVTAGHVVESADKVFATIDGHTYCFDKTQRVFQQSMDDNDHNHLHNDVAIYCIDNIHSPLCLSDKLPEVNEVYTNAYFVEDTLVSNEEGVPEIFKESPSLSFEQSDSVYKGLAEGNFFACKTEKILKKGNSGCPLLRDNVVYGILHGGIPGEQKCVYQSALSIIQCIGKIKTLCFT